MLQNTHALIDHICRTLLAAETRRLRKVIDKLIDENQQAYDSKLDGFSYAGEWYNREGLRGMLIRKPLHISLWPKIDKYTADRGVIQDDEREIRQIFAKLYDPCFNYQDLRCATPNCIADTLPENIKSLERYRDPTFFLNHERDFKQYEKALLKIELYSAARLLY